MNMDGDSGNTHTFADLCRSVTWKTTVEMHIMYESQHSMTDLHNTSLEAGVLKTWTGLCAMLSAKGCNPKSATIKVYCI